MKSQPTPLLSDQVRRALVTYANQPDRSRYVVARATGISEAQLSRFIAKRCGLRMETLDTLAQYLGLKIKDTEKEG